MTELLAYSASIAAVLGMLAVVLHAVAVLERSKHPELAKKVEAGDHFVEALVDVFRKTGGGEQLLQAAYEVAQSPHGKTVAADALDLLRGPAPASPGSSTTPAKIGVVLLALSITSSLGGCSSAQVAAEKTAASSVLQGLAQGVDWVNLHPDDAQILLEQARKVSSNPTLQAVLDKAQEANTAGNRAALQASLSAGALLLAPTPPGTASASSP